MKEKVEQDAASVMVGYIRMQAEMEAAEKGLHHRRCIFRHELLDEYACPDLFRL